MATNQTPTSAERARTLVNQLLDRGYDQATSRVMEALLEDSTSGIMGQRIRELEAEAKRLRDAGLPLTPDNPVLRATMADFETTLRRMAGRVDGAATGTSEAGVNAGGILARQLSLPGFDDAALANLGIRWNVPDPEAIAQVVNYTSQSGWAAEMQAFPSDILRVANNQAIAGIINGRGPLAIARDVIETVETLPISTANNLLRTLYLTSYRDSTSTYYVANADILVTQIRIATLDSRCCLACIALHGTELAIGERINDHHAGRCTSIGILRGRPWQVQTGVDWYGGLSDSEKLEIAGPANYNALKSGAAQLRDFVQPYDDRVFGSMVREASLKGVLGDAAQRYYSH